MAAEPGAEFQIGLTMSGAVSAGAYTAGVFDFLIQALDEWENARNASGASTIPNHFVGIKVMSGASAGAITAAIGAVALADADQKPVEFDNHCEGEQKIKCYLPKLYETWVVKPGLVAEGDEKIDFLETSDLDGAPEAADDYSRTRGIPRDEGEPRTRDIAAQFAASRRDHARRARRQACDGQATPLYCKDPAHLYDAVEPARRALFGSLRRRHQPRNGAKDDKGWRENCYHMISHGDRVHYAVTGLGTWNSPNSKSDFADNDQKREIAAAWLVRPDASGLEGLRHLRSGVRRLPGWTSPAPDWRDARQGSQARRIRGPALPTDALAGRSAISPAWPPTVSAEDPFWFTTADGGIIDNDPFEYARFSLKDGDKLDRRIESDLDKVDRAVIMVSPFPELKPIAPEGRPASGLVSIFSALLPALIDSSPFQAERNRARGRS